MAGRRLEGMEIDKARAEGEPNARKVAQCKLEAATKAAKAYLSQGRFALKEIKALEAAKQSAMLLSTRLTGNYRKGAQKGKGGRMDEALITVADYSLEIDAQIQRLKDVLHEISKSIYSVRDGALRTLLINRYIIFKSWEQIAVDMGYSWQHTHRLHNKALCEVAAIIQKMR